MKYFIILFLMFFNSILLAQTKCENDYKTVGQLQYQVQFLPNTKSCWIHVKPLPATSMTYRNFLFTEEGLFLVFNSYGEGDSYDMTGAREYYLFPRKATPKILVQENNNLLLVTNSLTQIVFDTATAKLSEIKNVTFKEDPKVHRENNGGFEILSYENIWIDSGFKLGGSPSAEPNRKSKIIDEKNHFCVVKNKEIFQYSGSGDRNFKFSTDLEFAKFLNYRCPQLLTEALIK